MIQMKPIGIIRTDFVEKFGTPRQGGMIPSATGVVTLYPEFSNASTILHLDRFSHVWLIYLFHQNAEKGWRPAIRPPRLGPLRKIGVFASRSPHRPNPIGMSAVRLESIERASNPPRIKIKVSGVDLLDKTPILDIKPYLPYADLIPEANAGWAADVIPKYPVEFQVPDIPDELRALLVEVLEYDPRPTSQRRAFPVESPASEGRQFGFNFRHYDVRWVIRNSTIVVVELLERH